MTNLLTWTLENLTVLGKDLNLLCFEGFNTLFALCEGPEWHCQNRIESESRQSALTL